MKLTVLAAVAVAETALAAPADISAVEPAPAKAKVEGAAVKTVRAKFDGAAVQRVAAVDVDDPKNEPADNPPVEIAEPAAVVTAVIADT